MGLLDRKENQRSCSECSSDICWLHKNRRSQKKQSPKIQGKKNTQSHIVRTNKEIFKKTKQRKLSGDDVAWVCTLLGCSWVQFWWTGRGDVGACFSTSSPSSSSSSPFPTSSFFPVLFFHQNTQKIGKG